MQRTEYMVTEKDTLDTYPVQRTIALRMADNPPVNILTIIRVVRHYDEAEDLCEPDESVLYDAES